MCASVSSVGVCEWCVGGGGRMSCRVNKQIV